MFISSHRQSCGHTTFASILLEAEVKDEEEDEDPGEARQTLHVSSLNSFPGHVRESAAATSCDFALSLSRPHVFATGLLAHGVLLGTEAVVHEHQWRRPRHLRGSLWPGSSLASLLPSWSNPRKVRRRTLEFTSKMPVTMKQASSRRTRGRKTPNSFRTVPGSSLASLLPSSSRHCPQVFGRRTREF